MAKFKSLYSRLSFFVDGIRKEFHDGELFTEDPQTIAALAALPSAARDESMGLWVWNTTQALDADADRAEFIQFLKDNNIGKIYLWVRTDLPAAKYLDVMRAGVSVYALEGDASYVLPANRQRVVDIVNWVTDFNKNNALKFTGISFDIEPYTLPGWNGTAQEKADLARQWGETIDLFVNHTKMLDPNLKTSAAMPFWIDEVTQYGHSLFDYFCQRLDEAALMSYRDQLSDLLTVTQSKLDIADKYATKVIFGLETTLQDPTWSSFFEEGRAVLDARIGEINRTVRNESFGGLAIHDYSGLKNLKP